MAEIFASREAYSYSENLILQFLRDSGYEGSTEDGTSLYDIVIKPNALLYTLFRQDVNKAYAYMSLAKAVQLRDTMTQDEFDSAVDGILSNWFVSRNEGLPSSGAVRMWYSPAPEYLRFNKGDVIGTCGGAALLVRETAAFTAGDENVESDYGSVVNTADNRTEYYVDVPAVASAPGAVEVRAGDTVSAPSGHVYFLRADIPFDFATGTDRESSEAFIYRTSEAITTRELITDRAIKTVLLDKFPEITRLYIAGHGDPELIRDIKVFQDVALHVGNMADIWTASQLTKAYETCEVYPNGLIIVRNTPCHVLSIKSDDTGEDVPFEMRVDEQTWLIPGMPPVVTVALPQDIPPHSDGSPHTVTVESVTSHVPALVNTFLHSDKNRVAAYDPQTKLMTPVVFRINVTVGAKRVSEDISNNIKHAIIAYVDGLSVTGGTWVESEMVKAVHNYVDEVSAVFLPTTVTAELFDPYLNETRTIQVSNCFELPSNVSSQITRNTVQYYTDRSLITVNFAL